MANPTSNFGWQMPTNTDLVKDLPADFEVFGQAVDTSLMDLKGGTTGQVLSKASNTDMDFTWVTSDDANAIQNAIVDAKGDLIAASAADTPARLAVGNNGETLVADSSASTGLRWQGNFAAGKNAIINGDFNINQRNFTSNTASSSFNFDRWQQTNSGGSFTVTPQTFTTGAAPVAGYEGKNFLQGVVATQSAASDYAWFSHKIESVRTLAGQTATISFWAKASSGTPKIALELSQYFGAAGSPSATVNTYAGQVTLSTSWARYSATVAVPSISGKTISSDGLDVLRLNVMLSAGTDYNARSGSLGVQNNTFQIWGVQLEAGNTATAFQTATGTLAGELAACQRYYQRLVSDQAYGSFGSGHLKSTTSAEVTVALKTTLRTTVASASASGNFAISSGADFLATSTLAAGSANTHTANLQWTVSGATAGRGCVLVSNNTTTSYIELSAEL